MYKQNNILGIIFIIIGAIGFFFALGDLLFKILCALLALTIINHGLRLCGIPPLQFLATSLLFNSWF